VALTLQTHLEQLPLHDDSKKELGDIVHSLNIPLTHQAQRDIARWGYALAEQHSVANNLVVV
jgi:hypothetical protein